MRYRAWDIETGQCICSFQGNSPGTGLELYYAEHSSWTSLREGKQYLVAKISDPGGSHGQFGIFELRKPQNPVLLQAVEIDLKDATL